MNKELEKLKLPTHVLKGIEESIEQANRGELITFDEVKKEMEEFLKKKRVNNN